MKLDPASPEAAKVLANVARLRGKFVEAEVNNRAAISFDPNDASVHLSEGFLQDEVGHLHEAFDEQNKALASAPANLAVLQLRAFAAALLEQDADALESVRLAQDLGLPARNFSIVYEQADRGAQRYEDAAVAAAGDLDPTIPDQARTAEVIRLVYGALADPSRRSTALAARTRLYPRADRHGTASEAIANIRPCLQSSYTYAFFGELNAAYELANQCLDSMAPGAIGEGSERIWMRGMRPFRRDPRFQALAARLGLMDYWRQYGPPDDCELQGDALTCR